MTSGMTEGGSGPETQAASTLLPPGPGPVTLTYETNYWNGVGSLH